ncbi:GDP-mannose 4,6-dehydratase [Frigoribacterium sp. CG_9.8]|uniref:GDP-mannose 4,6-dehydratase n=1 Tax=Frigoribacterium sp. CG_9.8 TaxID=2787733 RepID=UPI0018C92B4C|nr:GDP-mannose 4,6-dehydratase [Frigoribacterium sp. CG_9.8]MBG6106750.1 GDPmannose 4,6-dehydratase [Frigoribacterium sp. CG_9.8]
MTRAFITGISGQDGSYLADRLVEEGAEIHGLIRGWDKESVALSKQYPGITLHDGDLADASGLSQLIHEVAPDEIYNLAGISSVAQSWEIPVITGEITGIAVAGILDAALDLNRKTGSRVRVFQASSSEMFGTPSQSPQTESTPLTPTSPYGAAKVYAHHMVQVYRSRGLDVSSCIFYNHESPRRPETFVTRKITASAARIAVGQQDFLELGSLDVERDWGWAPDYVDAMMRATRHEESGDYVIATGVRHTVAHFVSVAFAAAGIADWESVVRVNPAFVRTAEISSMLGDSSKARDVLGWKPTVELNELVAIMVREDMRLIRESSLRSRSVAP